MAARNSTTLDGQEKFRRPSRKSSVRILVAFQRGVASEIKLVGSNLLGVSEIKLHDSKLTGEIIASTNRLATSMRVNHGGA